VGGQANWHVKLKLPNSYVILPWDCRQFINALTIGFQNSTEVYIVFIINIRPSHKRLGTTVCNMKLDDKKNHALSVNKCII
jgi:hypothetical protein